MKLTEFLKWAKDTFTGRIGLNLETLFNEFNQLAARLGIGEGDPLTDEFIKRAKAIYAAHIEQARTTIVDVAFAELIQYFQKGRVPKRPRRVGASTA